MNDKFVKKHKPKIEIMNDRFVKKHKPEVEMITNNILDMVVGYVNDKKQDDKLSDAQITFLISHIMDGVFYSHMNIMFNTYAEENLELAEEFNRFLIEESGFKKVAQAYKDNNYLPLVTLYFALPLIMSEMREKL